MARQQRDGANDLQIQHLLLEALGFRAVLPPPEERKHVKTAIGAARAEHARSTMR